MMIAVDGIFPAIEVRQRMIQTADLNRINTAW